MSKLGIPVNIEKSDTISNLNASLLLPFGMGMYTAIYFGTMYIYLTRSLSKRYIIPTTIMMLFVCSIVQTGAQWYLTIWQIVDNGDTRDSVFTASFQISGPQWIYFALNISSFFIFVLADGLLIWRCFIAWNRSRRIISVPVVLMIIEIVLYFVCTVLYTLYSLSVLPHSLKVAKVLNGFLTAAYFTSFVTSLLATALIAYRIYSASTQGASKRRFRPIVDIVVQSGAVYSLAFLATAIVNVLPQANVLSGPTVLNTKVTALGLYTSMLINVVPGTTTILVARVSMLAADTTFPSTSVHLTGLQFYARSTHQTAPPEGLQSIHSVNVDRNAVAIGEDTVAKAQ